MSDESTKVTAEEPQAQAEAAEVNPVEEYLRTAPREELMKNNRLRGMLGDIQQREREKIREEFKTEAQQKARAEAEAELDRLAREDQYAFAEKYLSKREQERIANDLATMKRDARADFAKQLGAGYSALPEWPTLSTSHQERLARSVAGKSDDEALVSFNAAALDVIAEIRADAKVAKYRETELPKEREAARQEAAAARLKNGARPALTRAGSPPEGHGWQDLPPGPEFNKAYNQWLNSRR